MKEDIDFQHIARAGSKGGLAHIDSQKQAEEKEDIKHTNTMLEEANRDFIAGKSVTGMI